MLTVVAVEDPAVTSTSLSSLRALDLKKEVMKIQEILDGKSK